MNTNMNGATPGQVTSLQCDTEVDTISEMDVEITNDQFILALFGDELDEQKDAWPLACSIADDPTNGKYWAQPWPCDTTDATQNWYVQPSVFERNADGEYRAQRKLVRKVYCVMLDDVGTKVPLERIDTCPPTWRIETSPGNYQVGYIFAAPIDGEQADALKVALIDGGLCDKGASGGCVRWMRLPVGINGKSKHGTPPFQCRMVEWNPERNYTVDEIIDRLELAPSQAIDKSVHKPAAEDDVYIPRSNENEVITALKSRGFYKQSLGAGKHDITCPWMHEHTNQVDGGSAYFEPSESYPIGGFRCQHSHGDKFRIRALIEFLRLNFQTAKHKPSITTAPGELNRIVDAAERELAATGRYYQRGGQIVSIATDSTIEDATIKPLSQGALLRAMSASAIWQRYDGRSGGTAVIDPPARYVAVLSEAEAYKYLPQITGIARQPHFRADGTLVTEPGFDAATGRYGVFDPCRYVISKKPSKADACSAIQELKETFLSEFEFGNSEDLAAALSGILTAAIRPCLRVAPMYHVEAPVFASGKSTLTSIFVGFAGPTPPSAQAFPSNEEECQKVVFASLLPSPASVLFDNLTTDIIPFKYLCSALTEEHLTGRILGASRVATVGTSTLFLSNGNNVKALRDMSRRCITISLVPTVETPATRTFKGNPLAALRADRPRYVSLALTVVLAWIEGGRPTTKTTPLASYEQWSELVRQPLLWLGMADPAACVFRQIAQDPDRESLGRMLHVWRSEFGTSPTMAREAVCKAREYGNDELRDALIDVAELRNEINTHRLGRWIARHQGRIVDGMRFVKASGTTSAERWSVKSTVSTQSISFAENNKTITAIPVGDVGLITPLNPPHPANPLH